MMEGGIPTGSSLLVAGPSGSGKTIFSMQFLLDGVRQGQPGLLAVFEKSPSDYFKTNPLGSPSTWKTAARYTSCICARWTCP